MQNSDLGKLRVYKNVEKVRFRIIVRGGHFPYHEPCGVFVKIKIKAPFVFKIVEQQRFGNAGKACSFLHGSLGIVLFCEYFKAGIAHRGLPFFGKFKKACVQACSSNC